MNKKIKTLALTLVLALAIPMIALANEGTSDTSVDTPVKTFGGEQVVVQPDGREIEYFADNSGKEEKIFYDVPKIIRTITEGENGKTVRYNVNQIKTVYIGETANMRAKVLKTGGYLEVDNVIRESNYGEGYEQARVLYVKSSSTVTFSGEYLLRRDLTRYSNYKVRNGEIMYIKDYDARTGEEFSEYLLHGINGEDEKYVLNETGLYSAMIDPAMENGLWIYIYVVEDVSYTAPKVENAISEYINVKVKDENYKVPAYTINGNNHFRLRDIAYILNGTEKQFNVVPYQNKVSLLTYEGMSTYKPVGGELKKVSTRDKEATPSQLKYNLDGSSIYPSSYTIDGEDFIDIEELAEIDNFGISWDDKTSTIVIDPTVGYYTTR